MSRAQGRQTHPRVRGPARPMPVIRLSEALGFAKAIQELGNGKSCDLTAVAERVGISKGSSRKADMVGAATEFGLVKKNPSSQKVFLTALGSSLVLGTESTKPELLRQAINNVESFRNVFSNYDKRGVSLR